jgi:Phytochelatin synthase
MRMVCHYVLLAHACSTQDEPAFCGLASIAMVLNALSIDPRRPWKGSWRWFHEELLDCCLPLGSVAKDGVNLSQVGVGALHKTGCCSKHGCVSQCRELGARERVL